MRYRIGNSRKWMLSATLVLAISSTGCQTGWKMPGASLFSWNKKPDPETLAGKGPSVYPTSPATKYTPSTVASATNASGSTAANSNAPTVGSMPTNSSGVSANQYAATMGNRGALPSGSAPSATAPGSAAPITPNSPYGGVAATANGYRVAGVPAVNGASNGNAVTNATGYATGPYATSATPTSGTISSGAIPGNYPGQVTNPSPNPYGASNTYAGVTSGMGSTAPASSNTAIPGAPSYAANPNASAIPGLPATQSINGAPAAVAGGYSSGTNFPGQLASRATPAGSVAGVPAYNTSNPTSSMPMMNPSAAGYSQMPNGLPGATTANGLTGSTSTYRLADTAGASIPSAAPNTSLPPTSQYPAAGYPAGLSPANQNPVMQYPATQNPSMQNPSMQNPGMQYPGMPSPTNAPAPLPGTSMPAAGAVAPSVYTAPTASSYRPGSTRDSSYDFSKGAAGASTGASTLPPMPGIGGVQAPSNFPTNSGGSTSLPSYNGSVVR
ncbi:MAG: hypothetical protein RLY14_1920 [Planctomycetota bacterium]